MVGGQQSIDVIAMEMRDHDHVDRLGVDAGSGQIGGELTDIALAAGESGGGVRDGFAAPGGDEWECGRAASL